MASVNEQEHTRDVTVANVYGLHARPAAEFVKLAGKYESEILVSKDGLEVNGKSIMGVMMLPADPTPAKPLRPSPAWSPTASGRSEPGGRLGAGDPSCPRDRYRARLRGSLAAPRGPPRNCGSR
jgi:phosphotransferase system HPr (HPr) family protein